ncbi:MAG: hypothetical protein ACI4KF_03660 [Huintestinicola sp.]
MSELISKFSGPNTALSLANEICEHNRQILPVTIIDAEVKFKVKYHDGVIKTHKIIMDGTGGSCVGVSRVKHEDDILEDVGVKFEDMIVRKQYEVVSYDKGDAENVGDV